MDSELFLKNWVLITTSRNPPHFLRRTAKVLNYSLPGSIRKNRGSNNLNQLFSYCWNNGIPRIYIIEGQKKEDTVRLTVYKLKDKIEPTALMITMDNIINLQRHKADTRINIQRIKIRMVAESNEFVDYVLDELYFSYFYKTFNHNRQKTLYLDFKLLSENVISCVARLLVNDMDNILFQLTICKTNQE
ncbi:hypothetical protein [Candidatus Hodarchaeum mangrovi]